MLTLMLVQFPPISTSSSSGLRAIAGALAFAREIAQQPFLCLDRLQYLGFMNKLRVGYHLISQLIRRVARSAFARHRMLANGRAKIESLHNSCVILVQDSADFGTAAELQAASPRRNSWNFLNPNRLKGRS